MRRSNSLTLSFIDKIIFPSIYINLIYQHYILYNLHIYVSIYQPFHLQGFRKIMPEPFRYTGFYIVVVVSNRDGRQSIRKLDTCTSLMHTTQQLSCTTVYHDFCFPTRESSTLSHTLTGRFFPNILCIY